jgi:hypothetical protein
MKTKIALIKRAALLVLLSTLNPQLSTQAQGTAFTYQGRLNSSGTPTSGNYDLTFTLFDSPSGGASVGNLVLLTAAPVSNGLFTVTLNTNNEFGATAFNGVARWLEIGVRTNNGGGFTTLVPRQPVTPTPYAVFAENVGSGGIAGGTYGNAITFNNAANNFSGSFTGNGAGVTNVNAATLGGLSSSSFWKLGGNAGANPANGNFIGTTDNLPLEFKVNGLRVLRLEQNTNGAPNMIGGSSGNYVSNGVVGATISGGGALNYYGHSPSTNSVTADFGTVGGGLGNTASAYYATVGGGWANIASDLYATVSGGGFNTANGFDAVVGGGYDNTATGESATVGGGQQNVANGLWVTVGGGAGNTASGAWGITVGGGEGNTATNFHATVSGGYHNTATGRFSTVPGGWENTAGADYSFAAGQRAKANHTGTFVWADFQGSDFASTATNQFLIRAAGGVGINNNNPQAPLHVTGGGDASLSSGGNFISGLVSGQNLVIDNNEIISRNNGAASDLILNFGSGNVGIGRTPTLNRLEVGGDASKATAGNWLANSDARIKIGVQTVTGALDKISRVRLVQFRYTDDYRATHPGVADREYLNVVAQEFQKVFPEDVKRSGEKLADGDDILQVDTYPLTIYSAAAIQELNRKLQDLNGQLKRRDAENAELKQRLEKLERLMNHKNGGVK